MKDHLALFREYAELERKRPASGVTPLEYQRWLDLDQRLGHKFEKPDHSARCPALLRVEFQSAEHFRDSYVTELSRGGIFVNTPFAPEIGTELVLVLRIVKDDRSYDLPGVVSSNNVSDGFSTDLLGMAVHFKKLEPEIRLAIDELFARVGPPSRARGRTRVS